MKPIKLRLQQSCAIFEELALEAKRPGAQKPMHPGSIPQVTCRRQIDDWHHLNIFPGPPDHRHRPSCNGPSIRPPQQSRVSRLVDPLQAFANKLRILVENVAAMQLERALCTYLANIQRSERRRRAHTSLTSKMTSQFPAPRCTPPFPMPTSQICPQVPVPPQLAIFLHQSLDGRSPQLL